VAPLVARSANEVTVVSGGRFCVCAFGRNMASVDVNTFSHLIYFIMIFANFIFLIRFTKIMLDQLYYCS
jgi:hypothetical protein